MYEKLDFKTKFINFTISFVSFALLTALTYVMLGAMARHDEEQEKRALARSKGR